MMFMRIFSTVFIITLALQAFAQQTCTPLPAPPFTPPANYLPFPALPPVQLDEANNGIGMAQHVAREKGVQGRVLWIDGLANIDRLNTPEKIQSLVKQVRAVGFNTVVLDAKPIPGYTLYPSKYAPRMTEWKGFKLPVEIDPLKELVNDGHAVGLQVLVNFNTFSEGHRLFGKGPGYDHPEWQTTFCEPQLVMLGLDRQASMPLVQRTAGQATTPNSLYVYTTLTEVAPKAGMVIAILDETRSVLGLLDGGFVAGLNVTVPKGGAFLVGEGAAADFLRQNTRIGVPLSFAVLPNYVLSSQSTSPGVPLWTDPNDPVVQQRLFDMLTELVTSYPIDGVVFDDRMRFANVNADMSEASRQAFEAYIGKKLTWPDDVVRFEVSFPALARRALPGPYADAWNIWRAMTIRNWLACAVTTIKKARAGVSVGAYVGSWYGEYPPLGSNWAANDFQAGFRFLTDAYRQTGFAQLLDWMSTGCYYSVATLSEAAAAGSNPGSTIEAAGQLSNRAANDSTWMYAGISLDKFDGNPDGLAHALQAAAATTQGVMVFDLSHKIEQFWPVFQQAFQQPANAPHTVPGLLDEVKTQEAQRRAAGLTDPPVIIFNGAAGTGL